MNTEREIRAAIAALRASGGADPAAALVLAQGVERLLEGLKVTDVAPSADSGYVTDEVLEAAASSLWFSDSSKHGAALWSIAKRLSPEIRAAVAETPPVVGSPEMELRRRTYLGRVLRAVLWDIGKGWREDEPVRPDPGPPPFTPEERAPPFG